MIHIIQRILPQQNISQYTLLRPVQNALVSQPQHCPAGVQSFASRAPFPAPLWLTLAPSSSLDVTPPLLPPPPPLGMPKDMAALIAFFTSELREGDKALPLLLCCAPTPKRPPQVPCLLSLLTTSSVGSLTSLLSRGARRQNQRSRYVDEANATDQASHHSIIQPLTST